MRALTEQERDVVKNLEKDLSANYVKSILENKLHEVGIPETKMSVKLFTLENIEKKKNTKTKRDDWIGFYKAMSQFHSQPIMYYSITNVYVALKEFGAILDTDNYDTIKREVLLNVVDTICHEYGHVIEEFLHVNHRRHWGEGPKAEQMEKETAFEYKEFYKNFDDNEEFAELFGITIARDNPLSDYEGLQGVVNYFKRNLFTEESLEWINNPKEIRDVYVEFQKDSGMDKFFDEEGMALLGTSKQMCERMKKVIEKKLVNFSVDIIKCSKPLNIENLGCEEVKFAEYVHYVLGVNNPNRKFFFDMASEHSFGKEIMDEKMLNDLWGSTIVIENENLSKKTRKPKIS